MKTIDWKKTALGIELGSTRIKATIIDNDFNVVAEGQSEWENRYENKFWTYSLEDIHSKLQEAYKNLKQDVLNKYGQTLYKVGSIGISAMMHGYMAFDENWNLLVPFRTWRNIIPRIFGGCAGSFRKMIPKSSPKGRLICRKACKKLKWVTCVMAMSISR